MAFLEGKAADYLEVSALHCEPSGRKKGVRPRETATFFYLGKGLGRREVRENLRSNSLA